MDFERARVNMVEQQVRTWEVLDQRVLDAMSDVPREAFVPQAYRNLAFADISIPLGHGQVMMSPKVEGRLLQALASTTADRVLEVGTGSGYLTALLARLAREIVSVDIYDDFVASASTRLGKLGYGNVRLEAGDALHGWSAGAPWDVIAVTGSVPELALAFGEQLAPGGRLFIVVGEAPVMDARLVTRLGAAEWRTESLFETDLPPLIGARPRPRFAL